MSSQPSAPIGQYADYLNVADVAAALDGIDDECVRSAIQSSRPRSLLLSGKKEVW